MSYILDALKKAEEARTEGTGTKAPLSARAAATLPRDNRPVRHYIFGVTLMLGFAFVVLWMSPWRSGKQSPVVSKVQAGNVAAPVEEVREKFPEPKIIAQIPPERGEKKTIKSSQEKPVSEATVAEVGRAASSKNASGVSGDSLTRTKKEVKVSVKAGRDIPVPEKSAKKESSVSTPVKVSADADKPAVPGQNGELPDARRVYALNELPSSIREGLPSLSLALHYYTSDPGSRLVTIDNRTVREGEEVSPGLKLEEITRNGAIFSYRKYHFFVGILQKSS